MEMEQNTPILQCQGLTKVYDYKEALSGVDLTLNRGRIVGLLGPNGSGKTTLIKIAAGLLTPTAGRVEIAGMRPSAETKAMVSYLPERSYLSNWMRVGDILDLFQDFYRDFSREKALEMLGRMDIAASERLKTMSKGTKEKVQLVLAMSRQAQLYLLDEPIGGVDPAARDYILRTILQNYSAEATVLISTHLISDIEPVLDEAIFIQNGHILLHRPVDDIRETEGKSVDEYFREVFKC